MTREEIVAALRNCASIDGSGCAGCDGTELDNGTLNCADNLKILAADLIENQQRHIEALLQASDALRGAWVPVTERLPENAKHPGALCPVYLVATKYGITEGWYNHEARGWFIVVKRLTGLYDGECDIDFKRGAVLRVEYAKDGIVTHWMPLPEAPEVE